jgi:hypothetical protein
MHHKKEKFHTRIIKFFLLLITIMVSLQAIILYFGASTIVSRLTNDLSEHLTERVINRFASLREIPFGQIRVMGRFLQNDIEASLRVEKSRDQFLNMMKLELAENPYLSSLYHANAKGDFIQITRCKPLQSRQAVLIVPVIPAGLALDVIANQMDHPHMI